jgi:hypothetical protein
MSRSKFFSVVAKMAISASKFLAPTIVSADARAHWQMQPRLVALIFLEILNSNLKYIFAASLALKVR